MGTHLDRARAHFGRDVGGLLDGGRYALIHSRSLEFDDLRPYVRGDDVRDIDWKATARSGDVLIKRFVSEKHHKILVVADAGVDMSAVTPTGERKRAVAATMIGALGLVTLRRADEIGMVFGDARGSVDIRLRRGETHVEYLLEHYLDHATRRPGPSDVMTQLRWVAEHVRRPHLVVVVSSEPDVDDDTDELLRRVRSRHDVMWAMTVDHSAVADDVPGVDVTTGARLLGDLGGDVVRAYEEAENERRQRLRDTMNSHGVPYALVESSRGVRAGLIGMAEVFARAG